MKPLRSITMYSVFVILGSALLSPWVYWLTQTFATIFPGLSERAFHRFVSSTMMVLALLGLWPLFRALGVTTFQSAGLPRPTGNWKRIAWGFFLGLLSLAMLAFLVLLSRSRDLKPNLAIEKLVSVMARATTTAIGVGILEELLFRGGIFGAFRRVFRWEAALLLSSIIYALSHFIEDAKFTGDVRWWSGLELLPRMFASSINPNEIIARFCNLTLAGSILAMAYQRTGNLWFSIGLHSGWIFWLASYRVLTTQAITTTTWWWGTSRLIDGWAAFVVLALMAIVVRKLPPSGDEKQPHV